VQSRESSIGRYAYEMVNTALWAFGAATALWFLFNIPTMIQTQRSADRLLILELADESRMYCEKWGMRTGTVEHAHCVWDVEEIREKHKRRILADLEDL